MAGADRLRSCGPNRILSTFALCKAGHRHCASAMLKHLPSEAITVRVFGVAVVAAVGMVMAPAPFTASAITIDTITVVGKRCDERRETLVCRRPERLDHTALNFSSATSDDNGCGCSGIGGAASSGSLSSTGQSSFLPSGSRASVGDSGQSPGGGGGAGDSGPSQSGTTGTGQFALAQSDLAPETFSLAEQRWSETDAGLAPIVSVPAPIVGAGLPGLMVACGGLLALARRPRRLV